MKFTSALPRLAVIVGSLFLTALTGARAGQVDITGPAIGGKYGSNVVVLPNGNFVVTDPTYSLPNSGAANVGAVYLYDGRTLALLSQLTGFTPTDQIGIGGVTVLSNGNFVVRSPAWHNGTAFNAGAVTWGSATGGVSGIISAANSLVGTRTNEALASGGVVTLNNGNYVVITPVWNNGPLNFVGAVTWCNGTTGLSGIITPANSLVGSNAFDQVGNAGVVVLNNGNYVVRSTAWNSSAGAVTWGSGVSGVTGPISSTNSLIGSGPGMMLGNHILVPLSNGNYVLHSNAGFTWGNGTNGITGTISSTNSITGNTFGAGNFSSSFITVTPLVNGHYVIYIPIVGSTPSNYISSITWGNGFTGATGLISSANSLVSSSWTNDFAGGSVIPLNNGNYVVCMTNWNDGPLTNVGAVTWANGTMATTGIVSAVNSLVGSGARDYIGIGGVTVLTNGNYVVSSSLWDNGTMVDAGAATWGSGTMGVTGVVSAVNSLVGTNTNDRISSQGITALKNGNYVVSSLSWRNGSATTAGAATWGSGTVGVTGIVSVANSLAGSASNDRVASGGATALSNGHYVVISTNCHNGAATAAGGVTWGDGTTGTIGTVSTANSLMGGVTGCFVGNGFVTALNNGNYVISSPLWINGATTLAGAVTWGNGTNGSTGVIGATNSLVGTVVNDSVGLGGVSAVGTGNYLVRSTNWRNGTLSFNAAGAVTLGDGMQGTTTGAVTTANSIVGTVTGGGQTMVATYDPVNNRALAGYPANSRVSFFGTEAEISVIKPSTVEVADGGTFDFGGLIPGANTNFIFTIRNTGLTNLTGLGITIDGADASLFTVTASPSAPVSGPTGNTTFTVQFAPVTTGSKVAALHIANNDPDENPFDINLTGKGLSFNEDSDGDGLSDATELQLSALGFDWQTGQPTLVAALLSNANSANLFTTNQIQALNINSPLIQRNPTNGVFTLTIGVLKSTNLMNFVPFPMTAPQTTINPQGMLEFQFSPTDNAAFFRLQSQ